MTQANRDALIAHARAELEINVPVYRADVFANPVRVEFHLYGRRGVLQWFAPEDQPVGADGRPPSPDPQPRPQPLGEGLTIAAGVGAKTAAAMRRIGIVNLKQMARAYDAHDLDSLMTEPNLRKLGAWLEEHGYLDTCQP